MPNLAGGIRAHASAVMTPPAPSRPTDDAVAMIVPESEPTTSGSASTRRVMRGALALFSIQPLTWASSFLMIIYAPQYLGSVALGQ